MQRQSTALRLNRHDQLKRLVLMVDKWHETETDACIFIKRDLKEKGWDVRNPDIQGKEKYILRTKSSVMMSLRSISDKNNQRMSLN
ncbi:MAG: hypothetical protein WAM14_06795 [Candidatus Nitrosopolaris sp.]